jgi:hypothetical protein
MTEPTNTVELVARAKVMAAQFTDASPERKTYEDLATALLASERRVGEVAESWSSTIEFADKLEASLLDAELTLGRLGAPTHDGDGGAPLSLAGRIEAALSAALAEKAEAWRALEIWVKAWATGRNEPLMIAKDHTHRLAANTILQAGEKTTEAPAHDR